MTRIQHKHREFIFIFIENKNSLAQENKKEKLISLLIGILNIDLFM